MPIMIECSTEDLEILLDSARETGDCLLILRSSDGEAVCLRARHKRPGRPRSSARPAAVAPAAPVGTAASGHTGATLLDTVGG